MTESDQQAISIVKSLSVANSHSSSGGDVALSGVSSGSRFSHPIRGILILVACRPNAHCRHWALGIH